MAAFATDEQMTAVGGVVEAVGAELWKIQFKVLEFCQVMGILVRTLEALAMSTASQISC